VAARRLRHRTPGRARHAGQASPGRGERGDRADAGKARERPVRFPQHPRYGREPARLGTRFVPADTGRRGTHPGAAGPRAGRAWGPDAVAHREHSGSAPRRGSRPRRPGQELASGRGRRHRRAGRAALFTFSRTCHRERLSVAAADEQGQRRSLPSIAREIASGPLVHVLQGRLLQRDPGRHVPGFLACSVHLSAGVVSPRDGRRVNGRPAAA